MLVVCGFYVFLLCLEFPVGCVKECDLLCGVSGLYGVLLLHNGIVGLWGMATLGVEACEVNMGMALRDFNGASSANCRFLLSGYKLT